MGNDAELAAQVMERIEALARISDETGLLVRTFGSPALRRANDLVAAWMRESGMTTREDAIGNLIGRFPGADADAKTLLLGSHLDTVRDAGRFDGALGVLLPIVALGELRQRGVSLPFAVEVIGFTGALSAGDLALRDANGISVREAIARWGGLTSSRFRNAEKRLGVEPPHL